MKKTFVFFTLFFLIIHPFIYISYSILLIKNRTSFLYFLALSLSLSLLQPCGFYRFRFVSFCFSPLSFPSLYIIIVYYWYCFDKYFSNFFSFYFLNQVKKIILFCFTPTHLSKYINFDEYF